ncbi:hypothetical protein Pflav_077630 [Phytohabitans flavus]|uniref:Uncharacterized protein n=1 Tax=Phytohabitans flavus TaxID=1076124 RepID=A0A6F8Y5Q2_9ACTN|nr:hypothetical protein Pflav_077630 [Phytohabitans flavus]
MTDDASRSARPEDPPSQAGEPVDSPFGEAGRTLGAAGRPIGEAGRPIGEADSGPSDGPTSPSESAPGDGRPERGEEPKDTPGWRPAGEALRPSVPSSPEIAGPAGVTPSHPRRGHRTRGRPSYPLGILGRPLHRRHRRQAGRP